MEIEEDRDGRPFCREDGEEAGNERAFFWRRLVAFIWGGSLWLSHQVLGFLGPGSNVACARDQLWRPRQLPNSRHGALSGPGPRGDACLVN